MPIPKQVAVSYTEEDAGYLSVRPVVKQTFQLRELVDMVVSVVGKDTNRVQKVFQAGAASYHGYHYTWEPIQADRNELETLLTAFPDNDPKRPFVAADAVAAFFEIGGGTQSQIVEITRADASAKKLFARQSAWDVLVAAAGRFPARYDSYSHDRKADLFRITLPFDQSQQLLAAMLHAATRAIGRRWSRLRPPSAISFVIPRS